MSNGERKEKYLGFRIGYADYMQTLEVAGRLGISVTDFILSILLPVINKSEYNISDYKKSKEEIKMKEPVTEISLKPFSQTKILTELKQKEKLYTQKLKSI